MRFVHPDMGFQAETGLPGIQSIVIEEPRCFREIIGDIALQIRGEAGLSVLSEENQPVDMAKMAELLQDLLTFDINSRQLQSKIVSSLEKESVAPEHHMRTAELISALERHIDDLAFSFPCDIQCLKLSFPSILKAVGIGVRDEYEDRLEKLIDYMELIREFDREKCFFTVNFRTYFTDEETDLFMETIESHGFHVIMLEGCSHARRNRERRITIDKDLCEF